MSFSSFSMSSAFRLSTPTSVLLKLGPVGLIGVWKFIGLGNMFPPVPSFLPKFHSGMKLDGLGKSCSLIKRDGSAEIGVAMSLRSRSPFDCEGGGGRANGFLGPVAPADNRADADGDGGGNRGPSRIGVNVLFESL